MRKLFRFGCALLLFAAIGALFLTPAGRDIRNIFKVATTEIPEDEKFAGGSSERLKLMHTATISYHESEDQFPASSDWMDKILLRMKTNNLKDGEAEKKLIRPDFAPESGKYGYAFNGKAVGKHKDDLKNPKLILIFESKQTERNATGDPKLDGRKGGQGVTISGDLVKLP